MSISQNFPSSRPSLNLNFARSKKLDPRITFTRTSTATYVDEDGLVKSVATDTPRFEHTPSTGESLGLLIEESRTNLVTYSGDTSNAAWTKTRLSVSANFISAPDNSSTAYKIVEDTSNNTHRLFAPSATITSGQTITLSVFFKTAERTQIYLYVDDSTGTSAFYAFFSTNGIVAGTSGGVGGASFTSSSFQSYPNDWYRISITGTLGAPYTSVRSSFFPSVNSSNNYQGDGTSGIYIWGAQLEAGSFATSYIPTVASTVTRSADNASITGTNFSGFYNPSEGTLFASIRNQTVRSSITYDSFVALCGSNVNNDTIRIFTQTASGGGAQNKFRFAVSVGGTDGADFGANPNGAGGPDNVGKAIIAYKTNDVAGTVSGITPATDTSVTIPTCVSLQICSAVRYQQKPTATIQQIIYYPVRLPNAQLQSLTSN